MAQDVVLDAEVRAGEGRSEARRLRRAGRLPGVIYGVGIEPQALDVDHHDLIRAIAAHGAHPLVTVKVGGDEHLALVKEVQIDAVRHEALHVDFLRVEANKPVHTEVILHLVGEPRGVKLGGGVLESQLRSIAIETLPRNIPEFLEYDVSHMDIADVARVSDLVAPPGITILADPEETIATVSAPRVEVEAAPTEEEAAAAAAAEAEGEEAAPADTPAEES